MEFLGDGIHDPRRALAEQLVSDFPDPEHTTIFAYNDKFEKGVIQDLADVFPGLSEQLLKIKGAYSKLKELDGDELERARNCLLDYCRLDTLATVKIWERLKEAAA